MNHVRYFSIHSENFLCTKSFIFSERINDRSRKTAQFLRGYRNVKEDHTASCVTPFGEIHYPRVNGKIAPWQFFYVADYIAKFNLGPGIIVNHHRVQKGRCAPWEIVCMQKKYQGVEVLLRLRGSGLKIEGSDKVNL